MKSIQLKEMGGNDWIAKPLDPETYPQLSKINSPDDLRSLSLGELPDVCADIRNFLISSLSQNPGHFASSMGAVELTVALHYVFNTPYDRIVWDVGHQAYGHKLLTGRAAFFHTNRKYKGVSGFPNPEESDYDTFTAGHASNSISAALGMAVASQLQTDVPPRNVVAVIGDASISGGLAFEGLNNAANANSNLLIILNDNDMSIDKNVGSLNSYLAHLTTSKGYNNFRYKVYNFLRKFGLVSERKRGSILRFNNSLKALLNNQQNIFEGLNIRYFGPFDGHDLPRIIRVLSDIKDMSGPRILHLKTIKGKGYKPAEKDPTFWHAPGKFNPENGKSLTPNTGSASSPVKFQEVFGETLTELGEKNPKIVGITAAMSSGTSINIFQKKFPNRTFDVGISEGHAVTFAGGLAHDGMLPYVAIYSSFLQRAYDHIIHDVAIQHLPVTFCIDRAGIVGEDGVTHHGLFDISYLRNIPGMVLAAPRDEHTLRNLMYTSQLPSRKGPWAIRYPRGKGSDTNWRNPMHEIPVGKGEKITSGKDVAVLSVGPITFKAQAAIDACRKDGIEAALYDMIFINPIDTDILTEVAKSGIPIVTIEDGIMNGGLGTIVREWINDHGYVNKVTVIGAPNRFIAHGSVDELYREIGLDTESIQKTISNACATK